MLHHASVPPKPAAMPVSWLDSDEGAAMDEEAESEQAQVIPECEVRAGACLLHRTLICIYVYLLHLSHSYAYILCCTSHTHMHMYRSAAPLTLMHMYRSAAPLTLVCIYLYLLHLKLICIYLLHLTLRSEQAQVISECEVQQIFAYVTRPSATHV
jgi:hypothetical protein